LLLVNIGEGFSEVRPKLSHWQVRVSPAGVLEGWGQLFAEPASPMAKEPKAVRPVTCRLLVVGEVGANDDQVPEDFSATLKLLAVAPLSTSLIMQSAVPLALQYWKVASTE